MGKIFNSFEDMGKALGFTRKQKEKAKHSCVRQARQRAHQFTVIGNLACHRLCNRQSQPRKPHEK